MITPADKDAVLAGLRAALAGPMPLQAKGGRQPTPGIFPTGAAGKRIADLAVASGWLAERPTAKPKKGASADWELTDAGRQHLADADSPRQVLEALVPILRQLADRRPSPPVSADEFRCVAEAAARAAADAVAAEFAKLRGRTDDDPLPGLLAVAERAISRLSPAPTTPPMPAAAGLRDAIRAGYNELCLSVDCRDGLVPIPRLFHEVARRSPGLTPDRFRRELLALRDERRVELHVLNEVKSAREPDLAIRENDRLLYFILWK